MKPRLTLMLLWCICLLAGVLGAVWMLGAIIVGSPRAWRIAIAFDQLANTTTGGSEDETISSRAWRAMQHGRRWGCVLCKVLDWFDPDHCKKSSGV